MSARQKCYHCGEPRAGRPLQRGTGFHVACFQEAMRAQERKQERARLSRAARDQYWERWVAKVKIREERSTDIVVFGEEPKRRKPVKIDRTGRALAGRRFEDAVVDF